MHRVPRDYSNYQPSSNSEIQHSYSKSVEQISIGETYADHQSSNNPWLIPKFAQTQLNPPTEKEWLDVVIALRERNSSHLSILTTDLNHNNRFETKANNFEKNKYDQIELENRRNLSRIEQLERHCEDLKEELRHISVLNKEETDNKVKTAVEVTVNEVTEKLTKKFEKEKNKKIKNLKAEHKEKIEIMQDDHERDIKHLEKEFQASNDQVQDLEEEVEDLKYHRDELENAVSKTKNQKTTSFEIKGLENKIWAQKTKIENLQKWQKLETEKVKNENSDLLKNIDFLTRNSRSLDDVHKKIVLGLKRQLEITNTENDSFRKKLNEPHRKKQCTTIDWGQKGFSDELEDF